MSSPLVSVLVPCYNVEKYIRKCLESLTSQTLSDFEVICINDGSVDRTKEIIEEFVDQDPRFVLLNKANSGYGASMNLGLSEAKGEYIAILESDDFMDASCLKKLVDLAEPAKADAVKANFFFYWESPKEGNEKNSLITFDEPKAIEPKKFYELFWYMPSIWSAIYRREFIESNSIRFLETPGASYQDLAFTFKVWSLAKTVVLTPDAFVHYRQDNENSSINSPGKVFCVCDEFDEMDRFLESFKADKELWQIKTRLMFDSYSWNYERLADNLRTQFFPRMCNDLRSASEQGLINYDFFLPGAELELRLLLKDPDEYVRWKKVKEISPSKFKTLAEYLKAGGFSLLKKRLMLK